MARKIRLLAGAAEHMGGERALAAVEGSIEIGDGTPRAGVLIATDTRVLFFGQRSGGYGMTAYPYASMSGFEPSRNMMGGAVTFLAAGTKVRVKWIRDPELARFTQTVRGRLAAPSPLDYRDPVLAT